MMIAEASKKARPRGLKRLGIGWFLPTLLFGVVFFAGALSNPTTVDAQGDAAPPAAADGQDAEGNAKPPGRKPMTVPHIPDPLRQAAYWFFVGSFVLASIIAMWFGIERVVVLRRNRVIPKAFVERFIQHLERGRLEPAAALELCEKNASPVAHIFAHGVRKWGKPSVEIEQAIIDGGERQVAQLRKHLRVLNGVATVSPLIGLLGTVWGMILAFSEIAGSDAMGNKAEELAAGIVTALVTTAVGLLLAIPALVFYMYLAGRVDALVMEMDDLAQNVVQHISAEGLASRPARSRSSRRAASPEPAESSSA